MSLLRLHESRSYNLKQKRDKLIAYFDNFLEDSVPQDVLHLAKATNLTEQKLKFDISALESNLNHSLVIKC